MTVFQLFLLALLTTPITALIKCSGKHSCYAESPECDPNTECQTVLHFDPIGNADIYIRNVSPTDYISIITDWDLLNTREYFICLPFAEQRLRALGRSGQTLRFNQQNMTKVVERLEKNYFRCIINADELEPEFRQYGKFIVARGKFQQFLKINEGVNLYKVEQEETNSIDDEIKTENFIPVVYNIAAPISKVDKSSYSLEKDPEVSKILRKLEQFLYYSDHSKALDIVDDLNTQIELKVSKKQRNEKRIKKQGKSQILSNVTAVDEDNVPKKKKKLQRKHKSVSDEIANKPIRVTTSKEVSKISANMPLHDDKDLDNKIYVRMTKQQMYKFADEQEGSDRNSTQNKNSEIATHDDDDEEVYVMMTKRQMYTFVDRQAERQVSDPKMALNKRNDSNRQLYTNMFLFVAVLYPFWNLVI